MAIDREAFKNELITRGLNWDDNEIDRYIALRESGNNLASEIQTRTPISAQIAQPDQGPKTFGNVYDQFADVTPIKREEKNAMLDFVGNALWEAADTATFGILGAVDYEDVVEDYITGGGPETYAGRVGAGLGGLAGFIGPFGLMKYGTTAAVQAFSKYGTKKVASNLAKKTSKHLSTEAGVAGTGYSKWNKLSSSKKDEFFKPFKQLVNDKAAATTQKLRDTFNARLGSNLNKSIQNQLEGVGIKATTANVKQVKNILDDVLATTNKSSLLAGNLQQRIAIALGGTAGAGKMANIASHALEEGLMFAAVETPMEIFQSIDEEREMNLTGRAAHAMALGSALGIIRLAPGGLTWKEGGITRAAWAKTKKMLGKKSPYNNFDLKNEKARETLGIFAKGIYRKFGSPNIFNDKVPNLNMVNANSIDDLVKSENGAKMLVKALTGIEKDASSKWFPQFFKEAVGDLTGSTPRMIMGSMAFNYDLVFADHIPLEDKVFHTLLGAYMTKKGRVLNYTDSNGKIVNWDLQKHQTTSKEYTRVVDNLNLLGMDPHIYASVAHYNAEALASKFLKNPEDTPDLNLIHKILEKHNAVVPDDGAIQGKSKKSERPSDGDHPLYEHLKIYFDGVLSKKNTILKNLDSFTKKEVVAIEKELEKTIFEGLTDNTKGITKPTDLDDIVNFAIDKNVQHLIGIHYDGLQAIYNELAPEGRQAEVQIDKNGKKSLIVAKLKPMHGKLRNQENKEILNTYNRMLEVLEHQGYLRVGQGPSIKVSDSMFTETIKVKLEDYGKQIDKLIYGEEGAPDVSRSASLMEEGWIQNLIEYQSSWKGLRESYAKMQSLKGDFAGWGHDINFTENDGFRAQELISELFYDSDTLALFQDLDISKLNDYNQRFVATLFEALKTDPGADVTLSKMKGSVSQPLHNTQVKALRKIFSDNGMAGFLHSDPYRAKIFIESFKNHSIGRFIRGATKVDGKALTATDRATVSELLELKIVGPNMQMVDILGVVRDLENFVGPGSIGKLLLHKTGDKISDVDKFISKANEKMTPVMRDLLEKVAAKSGKSMEKTVEDLLVEYKTLIEPFVMDGKGNGFINKSTGDITMLSREADLYDIVSRLNWVKKSKLKKTSDELLEQIEIAGNKDGLSDTQREKLKYIYQLYKNGRRSTVRLVSELADRKLYNLDNNKLKLDDKVQTLDKDLEDIIREMELVELHSGSDAGTIQGNINRYRSEKMTKQSEIEIYHNITKQNLIKKYGLEKDTEFRVEDVDKIIEKSILKSGDKKIPYDKMDSKQRSQFINDLNQVMFQTQGTRNLNRYFGVEDYGIFTDTKFTMNDNNLFRFIDDVIGKGFGVVDFSLQTRENNIINTQTDPKARKKLEGLLIHSRKSFDEKLRKDDAGQLIYEQGDGHVIIRLGDLSWGLAIPKLQLNKFGKAFEKSFNEWKKKYPELKKPLDELKRIYNQSVKKTEVEIDIDDNLRSKLIDEGKTMPKETKYEWIDQDIGAQSQNLQTLFTFMYMDKSMPGVFWDNVKKTYGGTNSADVVKLARRIRLLANTSMKEITSDHVDNTINLFKKHLQDPKSKKTLKKLNKYKKNGGSRILIAEDKSLLEEYKKQIDQEIKDTDLDSKDKMAKFGVDEEGKMTYEGGKDIDKHDSYMAVSEDMMDVLYALKGVSNLEGLGGIKPIINRVGNTVIIGKTAFIRDPRLDGFFKRNKVDAVLFESGVKVNHDLDKNNVFRDFDSFEDLVKRKLSLDESNLVQLLKPEDIRLDAIITNNHDATISFSTLSDLNIAESRDAYDWLMAGKIEELNTQSLNAFNTHQPLTGLSMAKYFAESSSSSTESAYSRWISNNGFPHSQLFVTNFTNQLKTEYIDKAGIMKFKTDYGGQSVLSPGVDLRHTSFRENAEGGKSVYTYGQILLPHVNGNKTIFKKNLHLIEHNGNKADALVKAVDIKGLDITDGSKVKDVLKAIKDFNKKNKTNYEMAVVARRNPHTRPGDNVVVGVKDLLNAKYGNQGKINGYDLAMRLEGDYDVDKIDYFWDTPTSILNKWSSLSGEVIRVNNTTEKNSLLKGSQGVDWLDSQSMNRWATSQENAMKLRGTVIKTQRILAALENYGSHPDKLTDIKEDGTAGDPVGTFSINLSGKEGGGYLFVDPAKLREAKKTLAEDIQNITDSLLGYDDRIYDPKIWSEDFLFGGKPRYKGIFSKANWNEKISKWVPEKGIDYPINKIERKIVLQAIRPYKSMLQLGTAVYSSGKAKKVQYDDILSVMKQFDAQMAYLNRNAYRTLRKDPSIDNDVLKQYFLKKPDQKFSTFRNVYGEFGTNIRPNFLENTPRFDNMLPFERTMAEIVATNNMKVDAPSRLYGEMLNEYHKFYEKSMYTENFSEFAGEYIKEVNKNDKLFGYVNYLDYRLRSQNKAKRILADLKQLNQK